MNNKNQTFCAKLKNYLKLIFRSAVDNQTLLTKGDCCGQFRSFAHLKKAQKQLRKLAASFFLAAAFLLIGILVSPILLNQEKLQEVYIPDGKGDLLIGNISKNQATVVFKTLDSDRHNPLATMAEVAIYHDPMHKDLVKKFRSKDYAVTHVISLDGLLEGKTYYVAISASEDRYLLGAKKISAWGDDSPITIYATGETALSCASEIKKIREENLKKAVTEEITEIAAPFATTEYQTAEDSSFKILKIQNESYIYGSTKVQVIISWHTNMPATSKLFYRYDDNGEKQEVINVSTDKNTKHVTVLTSLKPATKYYFKVVSTNEKGESATSEEYSLQTPRPQDNVLDMLSMSFKDLIAQIGL